MFTAFLKAYFLIGGELSQTGGDNFIAAAETLLNEHCIATIAADLDIYQLSSLIAYNPNLCFAVHLVQGLGRDGEGSRGISTCG